MAQKYFLVFCILAFAFVPSLAKWRFKRTPGGDQHLSESEIIEMREDESGSSEHLRKRRTAFDRLEDPLKELDSAQDAVRDINRDTPPKGTSILNPENLHFDRAAVAPRIAPEVPELDRIHGKVKALGGITSHKGASAAVLGKLDKHNLPVDSQNLPVDLPLGRAASHGIIGEFAREYEPYSDIYNPYKLPGIGEAEHLAKLPGSKLTEGESYYEPAKKVMDETKEKVEKEVAEAPMPPKPKQEAVHAARKVKEEDGLGIKDGKDGIKDSTHPNGFPNICDEANRFTLPFTFVETSDDFKGYYIVAHDKSDLRTLKKVMVGSSCLDFDDKPNVRLNVRAGGIHELTGFGDGKVEVLCSPENLKKAGGTLCNTLDGKPAFTPLITLTDDKKFANIVRCYADGNQGHSLFATSPDPLTKEDKEVYEAHIRKLAYNSGNIYYSNFGKDDQCDKH